MSGSDETTFKINDLLVSIVPASDPRVPTQIVSGTIVTNAPLYWPGSGQPLCGDDGSVASAPAGNPDPPLLAEVKSLLREQIAELQAHDHASSLTSPMALTVEAATVLETKLSAALEAVSSAKAALEKTQSTQ
jgi:hypothetical protein